MRPKFSARLPKSKRSQLHRCSQHGGNNFQLYVQWARKQGGRGCGSGCTPTGVEGTLSRSDVRELGLLSATVSSRFPLTMFLMLLYSFISLLDYLISYRLRLIYEVKLGRTKTASTALPKCLVAKGLNYNFESRGFFSSNYLEVRSKKTAFHQSRTLIAFAFLPSFSGLKSSGRQKCCPLIGIPSCLRPKRNTDTWSLQVCLHVPINPSGFSLLSPCWRSSFSRANFKSASFRKPSSPWLL